LQNEIKTEVKAVGLFHAVLNIIQVQCNDNRQPYITTTEIRQRVQEAFETEISAEQVQRAIFHWNKHKNSLPVIARVDRGKWTTVNKSTVGGRCDHLAEKDGCDYCLKIGSYINSKQLCGVLSCSEVIDGEWSIVMRPKCEDYQHERALTEERNINQ
jgi:hypothetical protein